MFMECQTNFLHNKKRRKKTLRKKIKFLQSFARSLKIKKTLMPPKTSKYVDNLVKCPN